MNRRIAPNYNREWIRDELIDDLAEIFTGRDGLSLPEPGEQQSNSRETIRQPTYGGPVLAMKLPQALCGEYVNQLVQNRFAEKFARVLQRQAAARHGTVGLVATAVAYERQTIP
jgi:hypothetical protein